MKNKLLNQKGISIPFVLLIVALTAFGSAGLYLASKNNFITKNDTKKELVKKDKGPQGNIPSKPDDSDEDEKDEPTDALDSASLNSTDMKDWEKAGIDSSWDLYKMTYLGFSVNIPSNMWILNAECSYNSAEGDHSYRPKGGLVPVQLINTEKSVFFANNTYTELSGETVEGGTHYYSKCKENIVDLSNIAEFGSHYWHFITETVKNDAELLAFARQNYGPTCGIAKTASPDQAGTFDVQIQSGGMEDEGCPVNFIYKFKYYPEKDIAVKWDLGQACTFWSHEDGICYDGAINGTFKFL